jgi:hypothetical protein
MYYNSDEIIQAIGVVQLVYGIKKPKLQRERYAVGKLDVPAKIFLVFETFEMQSKHVG